MNVDLPTPGEPLMPMRTAPPVSGSSSSSTASASARWSGRVDSARVMARASALRSPARIPSATALAMVGGSPGTQSEPRRSSTSVRTLRAESGTFVPGPNTAATPAACRAS